MAIKLSNTEKESSYPKVLIYGPSGVGKTKLCATAPKPVIITSENKLASLKGTKITVFKVKTISDLDDAIEEVLLKKNRKHFLTGCVDSATDIAASAIRIEKKSQKDPRKAYGIVQDQMLETLESIRDSNKLCWYVIAQNQMIMNDEQIEHFLPKMPGRQMGPALPYLFDYIFAMRIQKAKKNKSFRYLQTGLEFDLKWESKDSSGKLDLMEKPDLTHIFNKINGVKENGKDRKKKKKQKK